MEKKNFEKEEQVHFVKHFGGRKVRSGKVIYFNCFRSGKHCSRSKVPQQPMRAKTCCAHLSIRDLGR
ncbi:hypothetical protein TNCV_1567221 [Trichonephila clavipes]|nr:hypothetical protein TNCV_1567221 [Trichonephila clavipes]